MFYNALHMTVILLASCPGCVYGGDSCYTSYLQTSYCTYGCCYSSNSKYASCCTYTMPVGSWVGIGVGTAVGIGVFVLIYYLWRRRVAARRAATVASLTQAAHASYPQWQLTTVPSPAGNMQPPFNPYPTLPTVSPGYLPFQPAGPQSGYMPFQPARPQYPAPKAPTGSGILNGLGSGIMNGLAGAVRGEVRNMMFDNLASALSETSLTDLSSLSE